MKWLYNETNLFQLIGLLLLVTLLGLGRPAHAISIVFDPLNQTVKAGGKAVVNIDVIPEGSLVGSYDIDVRFFPTDLISLTDVSFGTYLDGPPNSLQQWSITSEGPIVNRVEVAEVSLGTLVNQDRITPFTLFKLTFDTNFPGGNAFLQFRPGIDGPTPGYLGDENGNLLDVTVGPIATINIVPEPSSLLLVSIGILGMIGVKRSKWSSVAKRLFENSEQVSVSKIGTG